MFGCGDLRNEGEGEGRVDESSGEGVTKAMVI